MPRWNYGTHQNLPIKVSASSLLLFQVFPYKLLVCQLCCWVHCNAVWLYKDTERFVQLWLAFIRRVTINLLSFLIKSCEGFANSFLPAQRKCVGSICRFFICSTNSWMTTTFWCSLYYVTERRTCHRDSEYYHFFFFSFENLNFMISVIAVNSCVHEMISYNVYTKMPVLQNDYANF